jgi:hypothetical protein
VNNKRSAFIIPEGHKIGIAYVMLVSVLLGLVVLVNCNGIPRDISNMLPAKVQQEFIEICSGPAIAAVIGGH